MLESVKFEPFVIRSTDLADFIIFEIKNIESFLILHTMEMNFPLRFSRK